MALNSPQPSFRSASAPYGVITSINYAQSVMGGNNLPVLGTENSNVLYFRIYNNWNRTGSTASMDNIYVTLFDDADPKSHRGTKSPVSQSWVRIYENGFGESKGTPGLYTRYIGTDTAIGNSGADHYIPEVGSDGGLTPRIRAGTDTNGVGFIEFASYIEAPDTIGFASYTFAVSVIYDWSA